MRKSLQDFTLKELTHHCEQHDSCKDCIVRNLNDHICDIIGDIYLMTDAQLEKKIELDTEATK